MAGPGRLPQPVLLALLAIGTLLVWLLWGGWRRDEQEDGEP